MDVTFLASANRVVLYAASSDKFIWALLSDRSNDKRLALDLHQLGPSYLPHRAHTEIL